jgi:hypothetical protein
MNPDSLYKFMSKLEVQNGTRCWLWQAYHDVDGYGRFYAPPDKDRAAHRLIWKHYNGDIPEGMTIDHLCRNRNCQQVDHMELCDIATNVMRGEGLGVKNGAKTHCPKCNNVYDVRINTAGRRVCRECERAKARARSKKRYEDPVYAAERSAAWSERYKKNPEMRARRKAYNAAYYLRRKGE